MASSARILPALALCAVLSGCAKAELYTGLSERDANEMLAALQADGLDGEKASKDGKAWTLVAPKSQFGQAVALLEARGLPRERYENLGEIFKKDGLISSPLEEHARLIYGLSQELSNTISTMDGVVVARVHIALPDPDPLADSPKPASASVFIKYDPQVDVAGQVGAIKSLLVNSVEGLPYDHVSVVLSPARSPASSIATARPAAGPPVAWIAAAAVSALAAAGVWGLNRMRGRPLA